MFGMPAARPKRGGEIAQSAIGLVRDARLQNGLILGRQRRLLPATPRLGLVVGRLAPKPADDESLPLALPVRVLRIIGGASAVDRHHEPGGQRNRDRRDRASVQHDDPPCVPDILIDRDQRQIPASSAPAYTAGATHGKPPASIRIPRRPHTLI